MIIKPAVYGNLSHVQRAEATLGALKRGDKKETSRLIESCTQKTYTQADHDFTDALARRIAECADLTPEEKADALFNLLTLTKGGETDPTVMNVITTVIHERSADWPPEDLPEDHLVSDELIATRTR